MTFAFFFYLFFFVECSVTNIYLSSEGNCLEDNDCKQSENPCNFGCLGDRLHHEGSGLNTFYIKLMNFSNDMSEYNIDRNYLVNINLSDVLIVLEPFGSDHAVIHDFPEIPQHFDTGTLFLLTGKNIQFQVRNVWIESLHNKLSSSSFIGSVFSTNDVATISQISLERVHVDDTSVLFDDESFTYSNHFWRISEVRMVDCVFSYMWKAINLDIETSCDIIVDSCSFHNFSNSDKKNLGEVKLISITTALDSIDLEIKINISNSFFYGNQLVTVIDVQVFPHANITIQNNTFLHNIGTIVSLSGVNGDNGCGSEYFSMDFIDNTIMNCTDIVRNQEDFILKYVITSSRHCHERMFQVSTIYARVARNLFLENKYQTHIKFVDRSAVVDYIDSVIIFEENIFKLNRGIPSLPSTLIDFQKRSIGYRHFCEFRIDSCNITENEYFDFVIYVSIPIEVPSKNDNPVVLIRNSVFDWNMIDFESLVMIFVSSYEAGNLKEHRDYIVDSCTFEHNWGSDLRMLTFEWTLHYGRFKDGDVYPLFNVSNCNFYHNSATAVSSESDVLLTISDSQFIHNTPLADRSVVSFLRNDYGLYENSFSFIIKNCVFDRNEGKYGGSLHCKNAKLEITDTRFYNGRALYGGALKLDSCLALFGNSLTYPIMLNVSFINNIAEEGGGAIFLWESFLSDKVENLFKSWKKQFMYITERGNRVGTSENLEEQFISTSPLKIEVCKGQNCNENECKYFGKNGTKWVYVCSLGKILMNDIQGNPVKGSPPTDIHLELLFDGKYSHNINTGDQYTEKNGFSFFFQSDEYEIRDSNHIWRIWMKEQTLSLKITGFGKQEMIGKVKFISHRWNVGMLFVYLTLVVSAISAVFAFCLSILIFQKCRGNTEKEWIGFVEFYRDNGWDFRLVKELHNSFSKNRRGVRFCQWNDCCRSIMCNCFTLRCCNGCCRFLCFCCWSLECYRLVMWKRKMRDEKRMFLIGDNYCWIGRIDGSEEGTFFVIYDRNKYYPVVRGKLTFGEEGIKGKLKLKFIQNIKKKWKFLKRIEIVDDSKVKRFWEDIPREKGVEEYERNEKNGFSFENDVTGAARIVIEWKDGNTVRIISREGKLNLFKLVGERRLVLLTREERGSILRKTIRDGTFSTSYIRVFKAQDSSVVLRERNLFLWRRFRDKESLRKVLLNIKEIEPFTKVHSTMVTKIEGIVIGGGKNELPLSSDEIMEQEVDDEESEESQEYFQEEDEVTKQEVISIKEKNHTKLTKLEVIDDSQDGDGFEEIEITSSDDSREDREDREDQLEEGGEDINREDLEEGGEGGECPKEREDIVDNVMFCMGVEYVSRITRTKNQIPKEWEGSVGILFEEGIIMLRDSIYGELKKKCFKQNNTKVRLQFASETMKLMRNIAEIVKNLHKYNYSLVDLSLESFWIDSNGNVKLFVFDNLVIEADIRDKQKDVFSFGVMLYEIFFKLCKFEFDCGDVNCSNEIESVGKFYCNPGKRAQCRQNKLVEEEFLRRQHNQGKIHAQILQDRINEDIIKSVNTQQLPLLPLAIENSDDNDGNEFKRGRNNHQEDSNIHGWNWLPDLVWKCVCPHLHVEECGGNEQIPLLKRRTLRPSMERVWEIIRNNSRSFKDFRGKFQPLDTDNQSSSSYHNSSINED